MNYQVMPEAEVIIERIARQRINPGYRFPSVSIFMPFDPKMGMKNNITFFLAKATDKVVSELRDKYPGEMSSLVIQKLKAIIKNLDFNTHKKSLAIFVSPVFQKTYYVNIDVEEKIIVNESLQIRDLVYSKKQSELFHILLLDGQESRIFLSNSNSSIKIIPEGSMDKNTTQKDSGEQVGYLPDATTGKDIATEKFLHQVDRSLDITLKHHMLPVFVMGTEKLAAQFKKITQHSEAIVEYVHGDYEERSFGDLKRILKPQIADWQEIKQKNLLNQLKEAANKNKLSFGMEGVRHEVINRRARLLLMEKKYLYDTDLWEGRSPNYKMANPYNKFSCIKNPIDEMIEKVLENGGDVEFVNNDLLKDYCQIARIEDY